jgi:hypothetical protein
MAPPPTWWTAFIAYARSPVGIAPAGLHFYLRAPRIKENA